MSAWHAPEPWAPYQWPRLGDWLGLTLEPCWTFVYGALAIGVLHDGRLRLVVLAVWSPRSRATAGTRLAELHAKRRRAC